MEVTVPVPMFHSKSIQETIKMILRQCHSKWRFRSVNGILDVIYHEKVNVILPDSITEISEKALCYIPPEYDNDPDLDLDDYMLRSADHDEISCDMIKCITIYNSS